MIVLASLKVYIFFATWCVPCKQELPQIARLSHALADRPVELVLVSEDGPSSAPNVNAFLARYDVRARVIHDEDSALMERYNPAATMPFVAIVGEDGGVLWSHGGYEPGDVDKLEAEILRRLGATEMAGAASQSRDRDTAWSVTSQTLVLWRRDDFRNLGDPAATGVIGRIDLDARTHQTRAAGRFDGTYVDREMADARDLRPEKISVTGTVGPVELAGGDGYASFGHGLLLSVRKIDPLGVDTTIRGGRVAVTHAGVKVTALGGLLNPQNTDPIELATIEDRNDIVGGLEVEERSGRWRLRQAAVASRLGSAAADGGDIELAMAGASVDLDGKPVRAALELVGLARQGDTAAGATTYGHGVYAMVDLTRGRATVLVEGKWYRHLAFGRDIPKLSYIEAPTLEREDQQVPGSSDALGGRLRGEWRWTEATTVFANALAYLFSTDAAPAQDGGVALHGYIGGERRWTDRATVSGTAGVRRETLPDGDEKLRLVQLTGDAVVALSPQWGATAKLDHTFETKLASLGPYDFTRSLASAGLTWNARLTLSAIYGYSTEAAARPTHYPGGELKVSFGKWGDVRVFGGRLVGGRMCVSGACRDIPPFEGARVDLALRL